MIALFGWTDHDPSAYAASLNECRRRMDQAARLGSPFIVASPPSGPVDLEFAGRRYADLLRIGREIGVRPSMEFLGFVDGIHTLASAKAIADNADDPDGHDRGRRLPHDARGWLDRGLAHDVGRSDGDLPHQRPARRVRPPTEQTDGDRVMVGEGIADLRGVIANLRVIGYRGPLSLELVQRKAVAARSRRGLPGGAGSDEEVLVEGRAVQEGGRPCPPTSLM